MEHVKFIAFQDGLDNISFEAELLESENYLLFEDKTAAKTKMKITIKSDKEVIVERFGSVESCFTFKLNERVLSHYKNQEGLEFKFYTLAQEILVKEDKLMLNYDYFYEDGVKISSAKIVLFVKSKFNLLKNY